MKQNPLDYARPSVDRRGNPLIAPLRENPLVALLLCFPGVLCWINLLAENASSQRLRFGALMVLWLVAVVTAITSIILYWRSRKRWFVIVCLILNVAGLLFTIWFWLQMFTTPVQSFP